MTKTFIVYILTNASRRTLYAGISSNITRRAFEHKHKVHNGFTAKYNVHRLVYYERYSEPWSAIDREKQIKGWRRAKKVALIEAFNPRWDDLARDWENVFKPTGEPRSFARVSRADENGREPTLAQDDIYRGVRMRSSLSNNKTQVILSDPETPAVFSRPGNGRDGPGFEQDC